MKFLVFTIMLISSTANAIPPMDCTQLLTDRFKAEFVEKISLSQALSIARSEGLLQGRELRSAEIRLERAKQIYEVYTMSNGGSAAYLVTTHTDCAVNDIIRVQEE